MPFDMLFQGKKNSFWRNTVNKYRMINVALTELMKPGCNTFHSYDDAAIGTTELSVPKSLKCIITKISENKDLLVLLL